MAPTTLLVIALALAVSMQATLGKNMLKCKDLNVNSCAYAIDSAGKRCVLEKPLFNLMNSEEYTCTTSEIVADKLSETIETEECISACGVDRKPLGISSDSLLDREFIPKLCSNACYTNCPNIVDLYFNLAAGEAVFLPKLCESLESKGRRELFSIQSSGVVSDSAITTNAQAPSPSPSPTPTLV